MIYHLTVTGYGYKLSPSSEEIDMNAIHTFTNTESNVQSNIYVTDAGKFRTVLLDLDCNQAVGGKIFPVLDDAIAYAKKLVA